MKKQLTLLGLSLSLVFSLAAAAQVSEPRERLIKSSEIIPNTPLEGVEAKRIFTDVVYIALIKMEAGKISNNHNHPDEQTMLFHTGRVKAVVGDRTHEVGPGDILIIPSFVPHHMEAIEESTWTEVHGPGYIPPGS